MPTVRQCDVDAATWERIQAAAGVAPATTKKQKQPNVRTTSTRRWSLTLTLPCRVISEANRRDHWTVQRRRTEIQIDALTRSIEDAGLTDHLTPLPVVVTWVRVGPGKQLDDDNLARAFKALRDALAKWLDVDDGSPLVNWRYEQRAGEAGVMVTIEGRAATVTRTGE